MIFYFLQSRSRHGWSSQRARGDGTDRRAEARVGLSVAYFNITESLI